MYSKLIVFVTGILFIVSIISSLIFSWNTKDTSIFVYIIPSTGGIFGASIIFYLNKAKMENVIKIKISFFKFKMRMIKQTKDDITNQEFLNELNNEFGVLEESLNNKIDKEISDSVSEDISTMNF